MLTPCKSLASNLEDDFRADSNRRSVKASGNYLVDSAVLTYPFTQHISIESVPQRDAGHRCARVDTGCSHFVFKCLSVQRLRLGAGLSTLISFMIGVRLKIGGYYRIRCTSDQDVMAERLQSTSSIVGLYPENNIKNFRG